MERGCLHSGAAYGSPTFGRSFMGLSDDLLELQKNAIADFAAAVDAAAVEVVRVAMMGRSVAVICRQTKTKITLQTLK